MPSLLPSSGLDERASETGVLEAAQEINTEQYPTGARLVAVILALAICVFLMPLDMTIVATAIPKITNDFGLSDLSWYASVYFMTVAGFQSSWGKAFRYFPLKPALLAAVAIFELGSVVAATAHSSTVLIIGRAISGFGAAGMSSGCFLVAGLIGPPQKRPIYIGIIGVAASTGAVTGPLIGGALTTALSWRWCFYINLPVGGVAALFLLIFFRTPASWKVKDETIMAKLWHLDPVGVTLVMTFCISFTLALQYAGNGESWGSGKVAGLLVVFVAITAVFVLWEWYQGEHAMIPSRVTCQRDVAVSCAVTFFLSGGFFIAEYYLPTYFQAVEGVNALTSGIHYLPTIIASGLAIMAVGGIMSGTGVVTLYLQASGVISTIAAGLLYMLDLDTSMARWIGYQILWGVGSGMGMNVPILIGQTRVEPSDMSVVTSLVLLFQTLGGSFMVSAGQAGFASTLRYSILTEAPTVSPDLVITTGAADLQNTFGPSVLHGVLVAYMDALKVVFAVATASRGVSFLFGLFMTWKKLDTARLKSLGDPVQSMEGGRRKVECERQRG
ncbi:MFS general substrate transporter [Thozetella sp. PMI_491]|nr:MFS general substrate transporter [Thozetella sp. PMI_491]